MSKEYVFQMLGYSVGLNIILFFIAAMVRGWLQKGMFLVWFINLGVGVYFLIKAKQFGFL